MTQPPPASPAPRPDTTESDAPGPGTRRRSGFVALGMVGTLALALSGCSSSSGGNPPSRCVDPTTLKVLDSHSCSGGKAAGATAGRWYYCGSGATDAVGGTFDKAATKRGGFGCPAGSSGSGGG
ncbi:hypothetical protein SAMN05216371_4165 [Streptomyces sp. TLI_053]|uniref:hypothetical protein n=1 Tax=Streptomyces sp. TLI_053 TaxID=1855352 RepID=UPI00087BA5C9|nr:hypothetical protein SAMN05216371_4165 [Streptomyces sp. TLI_053]